MGKLEQNSKKSPFNSVTPAQNVYRILMGCVSFPELIFHGKKLAAFLHKKQQKYQGEKFTHLYF